MPDWLFSLFLVWTFSHSLVNFLTFQWWKHCRLDINSNTSTLVHTAFADAPDIFGAHAWELVCAFRDFGSICFDQTIIQCDSQGFSFPKGFSRLLFPVVTQHTQHSSLTAVFHKECLPYIFCGLPYKEKIGLNPIFMKKMSVVCVQNKILGCCYAVAGVFSTFLCSCYGHGC